MRSIQAESNLEGAMPGLLRNRHFTCYNTFRGVKAGNQREVILENGGEKTVWKFSPSEQLD
jgi:hypothetical protein